MGFLHVKVGGPLPELGGNMFRGLYRTRSVPAVLLSRSAPRFAYSPAGLARGSLFRLNFRIALGW